MIDLPIILTLLNIELSIACGRAEYRIVDECCPMCSPGNRVHKHCTEFTSTSCVPCTDSTFLDEPNGLTACIQCTNCDPGFGLKVKQPCRPSSDTVCGTLEGFYCLDPTKDGCRAARDTAAVNLVNTSATQEQHLQILCVLTALVILIQMDHLHPASHTHNVIP
ncbi:hypothetical protein J4Q44_G00217810 [Coregonus suidteri]|uniref:TNFR-Cys domain-containing protein n=1 Tax=Coregonus suidteri TaxID=861788 RepID=A0AAN8QM32_9TELE